MSDELLAVFDSCGRRIGVKTREQVHRDGDWLVFVWAARVEARDSRRFLLQLRSRPDDPYRGQLDALAGGHVSAGESQLDAALRECREEAGLRVEPEELVHLGDRFLSNPLGVCRRVIERFYLSRRPIRLSEVAFTEEADGFVEVDLEDFAELLEGRRQRIGGQARLAEWGNGIRPMAITGDFLSTYTDEILDTFLRSVRAVGYYLDMGEADYSIWR